MLELQSVTKHYEHRDHAVCGLSGLSLRVERGEYVAVVGPSGSGKSTLLSVLGGMLSPTEGRVVVDGQSVYELAPCERAKLRLQKIGFVFQTFNLVPYLTAQENVQVPLLLAGSPGERQREVAQRLLERVGLGDRLDHKPSELSVGQQQRVALARVLANDPPIVLADEPTGNLDPEMSAEILGMLEAFNREGRTVVMVTHDPNAAKRARRTIKLRPGGVLATD